MRGIILLGNERNRVLSNTIGAVHRDFDSSGIELGLAGWDVFQTATLGIFGGGSGFKLLKAGKEFFGRMVTRAGGRRALTNALHGVKGGLRRLFGAGAGRAVRPTTLRIGGKQFSDKMKRRFRGLGLDPGSAKDRFKFQDRIQRVFDNAEDVRSGVFRGQGPGGNSVGNVVFFRRGRDVVVTSPMGDFVTFLTGGSSNSFFRAGTPIS